MAYVVRKPIILIVSLAPGYGQGWDPGFSKKPNYFLCFLSTVSIVKVNHMLE
jgi:hypothetical protein